MELVSSLPWAHTKPVSFFRPADPLTLEWLETLTVDRYRPMLRLLDPSDLRFLESQPGFRSSMSRQFRRRRYRLFQGYLRHLSADFQQTCTALQMVMLRSGCDRPELAKALLQAQSAFACSLLAVRFRLLLCRFGWTGVDVSGLLNLFGILQLELRNMAPLVMPSPASL